MGLTYKDSGVDVDKGNLFVEKIKDLVKSTNRDGVLGSIGGFGGLFKLGHYKNPVLVSGTDGVGTKLKLAFMANKHDTIGIDAVAMCVNDIAVLGAEPLFFLDYLATGKLDENILVDVVKGITDGCKQAGCALIGGETAEMPGFYQDNEYDIAGFAVGAVEEDEIIDGSKIKKGDVVIGLPSSGIHSNGYSLVRKLFFDVLKWDIDKYVPELGTTLIEELLKPTRIYVKDILSLKSKVSIKGIVHITGGGFIENVPRILPENVSVYIDKTSYEVPSIFNLIKSLGNIEDKEMYKTFNMGIGLMLIVDPSEVDTVLSNSDGIVIGEVIEGNKQCRIDI